MSRKRVVDGAVAAVLALLALVVALPFRAEALHLTPLVSLGWDAALHATEGLDLFDDMRLGRPLDAFSLLVSRHWWGPAWALVSAPFQAAFGPSLAAASLPSLVAVVLAPAVAFLLARRLVPAMGPVSAVLTGLVVAGFFLRSPMLLEISAWPMLESLGGLVALVALLLRGAGSGILALAFLLSAVRFVLEARGGDVLARRVPSVSNVAWGAFLLLVLFGAVRRQSLAEAWNGASGTLRDLVLFGALPCAVWCLDPANVRGWYRQIFQPTEAPERNPLAKLSAFWGFLREDYTIGAGAAGLVALGLVLALVLPGDRTRRALAAFAIWPVAVMSLNAYPVEPRFLACLAPGLFAAAASGLAAGASWPGRWWREAALAASAVILALGRGDTRWQATTAARAAYRFLYGARAAVV